MSNKPTQLQMFYQEQSKLASCDKLFLAMVKDGMTRQELQSCINHRPAIWGRFNNWLNKLPSE